MESATPNPFSELNVPEPAGGFDGDWIFEDNGLNRSGIRVVRELHRERSEYQELAVFESPFHGRVLTLDGLVMFTERDEFVYHEMLVHVPLCSHPDPRSVLIIGGGDCGCLREALRHPSIERVVQCDIDERVTVVSRDHFSWVSAAAEDPRAELLFDDGVQYVHDHAGEFDLVIVDSTDPIGPAVGLFREAFYRDVAKALRPGGLMTAQTESPHWGAALLGKIYAEQRRAFAQVHCYLGHIPTYPSGAWSWSLASSEPSDVDVLQIADRQRADEIAAGSKYYNADVHHGAFQLPNFVRRAIDGENVFADLDAGAHGFAADS